MPMTCCLVPLRKLMRFADVTLWPATQWYYVLQLFHIPVLVLAIPKHHKAKITKGEGTDEDKTRAKHRLG